MQTTKQILRQGNVSPTLWQSLSIKQQEVVKAGTQGSLSDNSSLYGRGRYPYPPLPPFLRG